jgi:gliding motility-associated-like protein
LRKKLPSFHSCLLLLFLLAFSCKLSAQTVECTEFDIVDFTLVGNAYISGDEAVLTDAQNAQFGAIWSNEQIDLNDDFLFETELFFGFNDGGADGIAFVLQALSSNEGVGGGGIGYQGILPSIAVEFDTWYNGGTDPIVNDHVAVIRDGQTQNLNAHFEFMPPVDVGNIEDGQWHAAVFEWFGEAMNLKVTLDGVVVVDIVVDLINDVFGGESTLYWGFTSSTGGANNLHMIRVLNYCITLYDCRAVPEITPSSLEICPGEEVELEIFFEIPPGDEEEITGENQTLDEVEYLWSTGETTPTILVSPEQTTTYYVDVIFNGLECRREVTIVVKEDPPAPDGEALQYFCWDDSPTLSDVWVFGEGILWYDAPEGGNLLHGGQVLEDGMIIYATQTVDGCESSQRLQVQISVQVLTFSEDYVTTCGNYEWNGNTYSASGVYDFWTLSQYGCDSTAYLVLEIIDTYLSTEQRQTCGPLEWRGQLYEASGTYTLEVVGATGCDSIFTLVLDIVDPVVEETSQVACLAYEWQGNWLTESGVYRDTLVGPAGCDSIVVLNLAIEQETYAALQVSACDAYEWPLNGQEYTEGGQYSDTLVNAAGCDSIVVLTLDLSFSKEERLFVEQCSNYFWSLSGENYQNSGVYSVLLNTAAGCDSLVLLELTIFPEEEEVLEVSVCDAYTWGVTGLTYTESGRYEQLYFTDQGCDSLVVLDLKVQSSDVNVMEVEACLGFYWEVTEQYYELSGVYTDTLVSSLGCDSVMVLRLGINQAFEQTQQIQACEGYFWEVTQEYLSASGQYIAQLQTVQGCDSIFVLQLEVHPSFESHEQKFHCGPYFWEVSGEWLTEGGSYSALFSTTQGCDSLYTLELSLGSSYAFEQSVSECGSYFWAVTGQNYVSSGLYTASFLTQGGCDSLYTLDLQIGEDSFAEEVVKACDEFIWEVTGGVYTQSGTYEWLGSTEEGCDSLRLLTLDISPSYTVEEYWSAFDEYVWPVNNRLYTESGRYEENMQTQGGCDSIAILNLEIKKRETVVIPNVFTPNGDGVNDVLVVLATQGIDRIQRWMIFDRWGALLFEVRDFSPNQSNLGWDGRYKGQMVSSGVYVYLVEYTEPSGKARRLQGDVTLLR